MSNPVRTDTLEDRTIISPYQRPVRHRVLGGVVNDTGPPLTLCRKVYPYKMLPVGQGELSQLDQLRNLVVVAVAHFRAGEEDDAGRRFLMYRLR